MGWRPAPKAWLIDLLQRLQRELDGVELGESIAAETARLGFGEATEERLRGPIIRIVLVRARHTGCRES